MTRDTSHEEASVFHSASDNILVIDATFGLLIPGMAIILMPSLFQGSSAMTASTVVLLILQMFFLSVHLGFQDSPAYPPIARLLLLPLAIAPIQIMMFVSQLSLIVSLCAIPTALVFARAAWCASKRL